LGAGVKVTMPFCRTTVPVEAGPTETTVNPEPFVKVLADVTKATSSRVANGPGGRPGPSLGPAGSPGSPPLVGSMEVGTVPTGAAGKKPAPSVVRTTGETLMVEMPAIDGGVT
jgi:hypothetical protein